MSFATMLAEMAGVDLEEARRREQLHEDHSAAAESFSNLIDRKRQLVDRLMANEESGRYNNYQSHNEARRGHQNEEVTKESTSVEFKPKDDAFQQQRPKKTFQMPEGNKPRSEPDQGLDL